MKTQTSNHNSTNIHRVLQHWTPVMLAASLFAIEGRAQTVPTAPTTVEAENMTTKTVGQSYSGLHNIWSNGYIANDVRFNASGTYTFNIIASGSVAGGVYPQMVLRIDGRDVKTFNVNSTSMKTFTAQVSITAGTHSVAIAFTNDAVINGQDRNLLVDKVSIAAPPSMPTPAPTPVATPIATPPPATPTPTPAPSTGTVPSVPATIEAENMETKTAGGGYSGVYNIWSNGKIENRVNFPAAGTFDVTVLAYGQMASGVGPNMDLLIDDVRVTGKILTNTTPANTVFRITASAGIHRVALAFTNDLNTGTEDRNLVIDRLSIAGASSTATPVPTPTPPPATATPIATPPPATPTPAPSATPAPVNGISMPFGTHPMQYAAGTIKPAVGQSEMDAAVQRSYDLWKSRYVSQMCGTGRYVVKGGQNGYLAVSEGQGYGMLITVMMAGYDSQARTIFDGIHRFSRDKASNYPYMMSWLIANDCSVASGQTWPAVDGDLDMALALLMAHKQWGSSGGINYLQEAQNTINSIKANIVKNNYIAGGPAADLARTSDFMFAHFRAFQKYTGDATWGAVLDKTISLIDYMQRTYSPNAGLMPDFIEAANTSTPRVVTISRWPESNLVDKYAYNACRNPWRFATDVAVSGDARTRAITQKMMNFFRQNSNEQPTNIRAVYRLDGAIEGNYQNMSFQAPLGAGAIVDSSNQNFLNNLWSFMVANTAPSYYDHSIQLISMMVMSGNWWQP